MEQQNVTPIYFVSLGCDKNLVDSEMMITSLREQGFRLVNEETEAEVIAVLLGMPRKKVSIHC